MAAIEMPSNDIGLTKYNEWCDWGDTLEQQLTKGGVPHQRRELADVYVPWAGDGCLVMYTSPRTSEHVVVLAIPQRYDVDSFAEQYYYFEGMTAEQAGATDWMAVALAAKTIKDDEMERRLRS